MDDTDIITYQQLVILTRWMADNYYTADDIAYAVEKPYKYRDELKLAIDIIASQVGVSND